MVPFSVFLGQPIVPWVSGDCRFSLPIGSPSLQVMIDGPSSPSPAGRRVGARLSAPRGGAVLVITDKHAEPTDHGIIAVLRLVSRQESQQATRGKLSLKAE